MKKQLLFLLSFLISVSVFAQYILSGKVYDENGKPLSGVLIFEKGSMNGTQSGVDGLYSIPYKDSASVIAFSYIGYLKHQIITEGKSHYDAALILNNTLSSVEIVGTRRLGRTQTETAVGVDVIDISKLANSAGQINVDQLLESVAPSFNATKQSGADGADHIVPATLRGLGPDQTLVLINGKRQHQSSLINIFGTRGRGNTGTDLNAIPVAAIDRIEILRDGASAQYGSDAIAGVINIVLKSSNEGTNGKISYGMNNANPPAKYNVVKQNEKFDGKTWQADINQGLKIGKAGFANFTLECSDKQHTNRPALASAFTDGVSRNQFGDAAASNISLVMNSSIPVGDSTEIYAFGGYNHRFTDAYAWTRTADESRNITDIYPTGFDPKIQSIINDKSLSFGIRSKLCNGWNVDLNNTLGSNQFHFFVDHTLNASLLEKSPTRFDAGGFSSTENTTSLNFSKLFSEVLDGLNFAFGTELRTDNYKIFAGEEASWKTYGKHIFKIDSLYDVFGNFIGLDTVYRPGGAQGFPGFQPLNEVNETRTNIATYVDAELDFSDNFMIGAAARFENYSDFGSTLNGKISTRFKINNYISLRGAYSTGFRAPSLQQLYYNTTFTDFVAGKPVDKIITKNNSPLTQSIGIPPLKEEKSNNISYGFAIKYKSLSLTVDGYSIAVKDRIVLTGAFYDNDTIIGNSLKTLGIGAAQFFTNAVNTTTNGVDIVLGYTPLITNKQVLRLSATANFNQMKIDDIYTNVRLQGKEQTYFGLREQYFLLASAPKSKISLSANYSYAKFFIELRENQYGKVELINWKDNGNDKIDPDELDVYKAKWTTDLSIGYNFNNIRITVGGLNIFNQYPDAHNPAFTETGGLWDAVQMGFAGAYYYTKIGFTF